MDAPPRERLQRRSAEWRMSRVGVAANGHLGQVRHRSEAVACRIEQHAAKLEARLEALRGSALSPAART